MSTWINFKDLRANLDFEQVLRHYKVEVKRKGDQHLGYCPLPNHNGNRNSPSFSANLKRGIFQCFGCGSKGNVLEFAAYMEQVDLRNGSALREVAIRLQQRFCVSEQTTPSRPEQTPVDESQATAKPTTDCSVIINEPLDFELKGLDPRHPYLSKRGFTAQTIEYFGVGFCSRGMLKDRIAIPLQDHQGRLIGYAGRVIDDASVSEGNPRYRFPGTRNRNDRIYDFRKSQFLYNGFRFKSPVADLFVVEGFTSVWWLHQLHYPQVVATMGADCSAKQSELIISLVKCGGRVWIVPDGDAAGDRLADSLLQQVSPHRFVRRVKLNQNVQPTDLSAEQFKTLFTL